MSVADDFLLFHTALSQDIGTVVPHDDEFLYNAVQTADAHEF